MRSEQEVRRFMAAVRGYGSMCAQNNRNAESQFQAIEAALRDAPQAEGWVMVPVEPTREMIDAYLKGTASGFYSARSDWANMLAARPSAPTAVEPDERAEFEAWAIEQPYIAAKDSWDERSRYGAKEYENHEVQLMWEAWQALASKGAP